MQDTSEKDPHQKDTCIYTVYKIIKNGVCVSQALLLSWCLCVIVPAVCCSSCCTGICLSWGEVPGLGDPPLQTLIILPQSCPTVSYSLSPPPPPPLPTLSLFSYVYTGSLPHVMSLDTARELGAMAAHSPAKLIHLSDICKGFIENQTLKQGDWTRLCQLVPLSVLSLWRGWMGLLCPLKTYFYIMYTCWA